MAKQSTGRAIFSGYAEIPADDDERWVDADEAIRLADELADEAIAQAKTRKGKARPAKGAQSIAALGDRVWAGKGKKPPVVQPKGKSIEDLGTEVWAKRNGGRDG